MSRLRFPGKKTKAVQDPSKNKDFSSDDSNWTNLKLVMFFPNFFILKKGPEISKFSLKSH